MTEYELEGRPDPGEPDVFVVVVKTEPKVYPASSAFIGPGAYLRRVYADPSDIRAANAMRLENP